MPTQLALESIARRAMVAHGLLPDFSPDVLSEITAIVEPATAGAAAGSEIRDLRSLLWASIDNDTSRDLDQLSVAEAMPSGALKVYVAIADVDAIVKRRSAIDSHAQTNTTSVYTAAQIFPMLPTKLSTNLTSLGQDADRLAIVIEMVVDANGVVGESDVYRATVRNRAKLAYNSVAAWLDGSGQAPSRVASVPGLDDQLRMQDRAAQAMRAIRFQHGALQLETPQAQPVFEGDVIRDLVHDEPNRAKELIEDFMIAANGVTARYLAHKGFPSLRRVLRVPERWDRIVSLAQTFGDFLPAEPSCEALAKFLAKRRSENPARFPDVSLSVVKLLGRGEYVLELPGQKPEGHFGLAVSDYTHSTAPNRRFPDLITQRLLKAALGAKPAAYTPDELKALAAHCTDQETNAAKVERQVMKSAAAQLLAPRIGQQYDATVTGASTKGTWVRIQSPSAEGRLIRGFQGLDVGDPVRVELVHTDVERGFIDFARAGR
jgi:VacB/RNase II family 3'-5' exoribonuclease